VAFKVVNKTVIDNNTDGDVNLLRVENVPVLVGDGNGNITLQNVILNIDSDSVSEGSNNLYFTDARAQAALAGDIINLQTNIGIGDTNTLAAAQAYADSILVGNLSLSGHIIPSVDSDGTTGFDLGSPSKKWRDLYLSEGSLYINNQKVIEDSAGTIIVRSNTDQSLLIKTEGTGVLTLESDSTINVSSTLQIQSGKRITDSGGNAIQFGDKVDMDNNQIINVGSPTSATDGVNKAYVDSTISTISTNAITEGDSQVEIADLGTGTVIMTVDGAQRFTLSATELMSTVPMKINSDNVATEIYADQAEADAKAYTDTREAAITTAYQTYTDTAEANAVSTSNNYTDQAEADAKAYTDTREAAITTAYESYTDQAEADAKAYTDTREAAITTAYESYTDQAEADAISTASADATSKANAAQSAAISTASSDATSKANAAQSAAISTASSDATSKANAAQATAISTASADATTKADAAQAAAATDATTKANTAESNAISAAATDATTKADAAEANAATDATTKADAAEADAISTASADATTKADTAKQDAINIAEAKDVVRAAASNLYADTAEADAKAYTDTREVAITTAYEAYADQAEVDAVSTANSYTDTAVANVIDSAPAVLDTLNELAAALGDDANFATTVSNDIGTKVSKTGDTMTGDLTLAGAPSNANHAASKAYVDSAVSGGTGALDTDDIAEAGNLYYTNARVDARIPTNISSFTNDSSYATTSQLFSGSYTDLSNKPTIPTNNNQLTNGASYATTSQLFSGSYDDLTNKPTIPTNNNQLTNGASYATTSQLFSGSYDDLSDKPTIPTNNNQLTNGAGYITSFTDTNTTYTAGTGLNLVGTTFNNTAPDQTVSLTGSGATSISGTYPNFTISSTDTNTNTTYSTATSSTLGLVKIGYSENGKNYPVELSSGKMYVNVPWVDTNTDTNTTYSDGNGIGLSSTTFSVSAGNGLTQEADGLKMSGSYTGTFTASGDICAYSDKRLKRNIQTIDNALDTVHNLRGVTFEKSLKPSIGVIAQEVEEVLPELVNTDADGMKSVAYGNIVGVLIEAIKEQQKQIEELKNKFKDL